MGNILPLIAETLEKHEAFFGQFTNVKIKDAFRQQQTQLVDELLEAFRKRVSRLNNLLIVNEVEKTPLYEQFFPHGVMAFTDGTNKGNALSNMTLIHKAVQANTGVSGGSDAVDEFANFMVQWDELRSLQIRLMGETIGGRTTRDAAGAEWEKQMFKNLLTLALQFIDQPEMVDDFFNQSILCKKSKAREKEEEEIDQ